MCRIGSDKNKRSTIKRNSKRRRKAKRVNKDDRNNIRRMERREERRRNNISNNNNNYSGESSGWTLFGVTSFGDGCGVKGKYGVYARVPNFVDWIHKIIKENS